MARRWPALKRVELPVAGTWLTLTAVALLTVRLIAILLAIIEVDRIGEHEGRRFTAQLRRRDVAARYPRVRLEQAPLDARGGGDAWLISCSVDWCLVLNRAALHLMPRARVTDATHRRWIDAAVANAPEGSAMDTPSAHGAARPAAGGAAPPQPRSTAAHAQPALRGVGR